MSLNAKQIGELVAELAPLLSGARLRDLVALPPRDVLLVLEPDPLDPAGPAVWRLRLSADGDAPRLHLQQGRQRNPSGPAGPFYQRVAAELADARLVSLAQVRGDRIVLLEFRETAANQRRALLAELTGRHANLVLLGRNDEVLALLVAPPPPKDGRPPRLVVGAAWQPPPGKPPAAAELDGVVAGFPEPHAPPPAVAAGHPQRAPLSWRVEAALSADVRERDRAAASKKLLARVDRKLGRARALLAGLEQKLAATSEAERVRLDGELLTACLGRLARGLDHVVVEDWYSEGAPQRRIELDPKRGPRENVERYFERYKKLERARAELPGELERARRRLADLEALRAATLDDASDLDALEADAVDAGLLDPAQEGDPRKRKAPGPRVPYRVFQGCKGSEIRVGRTARDNDALTFKHARGNDLWLHTAEAPGSHVVLCMGGRRGEPDPEELLDAAHLAVHFSPLREAKVASVHVAPRKLVHKPRGAKAGLVTLSGGRRIELRMQPERIARLVRPERAS